MEKMKQNIEVEQKQQVVATRKQWQTPVVEELRLEDTQAVIGVNGSDGSFQIS